MKRTIFLVLALILGLQMAWAQDIITTKSGNDIQAKVVEVGIHNVKYKKFANPDGPEYTIPKDNILIIRYENGEKDIFEYEPTVAQSAYYNPQIRPGMRYKDYKRLYKTWDYVRSYDDPYSPFAAGMASYLFPGMGQCISGEYGRGVCFFSGTMLLGMALVSRASYYAVSIYPQYDSGQGYYYTPEASSVDMFLLSAAFVGVYVWNICDAVRVAKVKNMYYQDISGYRMDLKLHIEPYLNYNPMANPSGSQMATGLSLKVDF